MPYLQEAPPPAWPDEVTMVDESMVCRGTYNRPRDQHCAIGWRDVHFIPPEELHAWRTRFLEHAKAAGAALAGSVEAINDHPSNPLSLIARLINRTWASFGYVVGNPECDSLGRLKPFRKTGGGA